MRDCGAHEDNDPTDADPTDDHHDWLSEVVVSSSRNAARLNTDLVPPPSTPRRRVRADRSPRRGRARSGGTRPPVAPSRASFVADVSAWCRRSWHQYVPREEVVSCMRRWHADRTSVSLAYFPEEELSWRYQKGRSGTLLRVEEENTASSASSACVGTSAHVAEVGGEATPNVPMYVVLRRYDGRISRVRADRWGWLFKLMPAQAVLRELHDRVTST